MAHGGDGRVIASIYSALLGEIGWDNVVDEIATVVCADMAVMFYHDAGKAAGAITLASGVTERIMHDYSEYYATRNPWMISLPSIPIGKGVVGEEVLLREQFMRTEYYNDFLRPHDQETSVGVTVRQDEGCFFLMSLLSGDRDFERNRERARQLTSIAPHLGRASDFYRRQAGSDFMEGLSEASGFATVVVNGAARVTYATSEGAACLAAGDPLGIDAAGRVSFRDPMAQSMFEHALRGHYSDLLTRTVAVGGREVSFVRTGCNHGSAIFLGGTLAILVAGRPDDTVTALQRIAQRYGLTPAERRVLEGIVCGLDIREIAASASVTKETVRSQLKAIYGKTGVNRQSGLVRLVAGLAVDDDMRHEGSRRR